MFRRLFLGIVAQRLLVLLVTLIVVLLGVRAWWQLPIDAFPDVTNVQVMILTEAPGLSPLDVERRISFPIELQMGGLPSVQLVRSLSKAGLSQVVVVFDDDVDIYFARQLVFERLQGARDTIPEWAEPELGPVSTGLGEIYQYTLESDTHSLQELRTIQDWLVAPMLRPLRGVTEVNSFGGFVRQFQVLVDPFKLQNHGVDIREVIEALARNNANSGGGYILKGEEQAYVRCDGLLRGVDDIGNVVIKASDGTPVQVADIATVAEGPETRQGAVTRDGKGDVVCGMVILLRGANSKQVVQQVKEMVPKIRAALPEGVTLNPFYDRTSLIEACVSTISSAIGLGALLVMGVLLLLLGSLRTATVVIMSLPIAAILTFIMMDTFGITANLMSLGGLAIAIGMVVDASIVVSENMLRRFGEREIRGERSLLRAAVGACTEVARPLLFAELIIIVTIFPLFTLEGMEGKMFGPLATTLCIAIVASVITAFTVIPALGAIALAKTGETRAGPVFRLIRRTYLFCLRWGLQAPRTVIVVATALFVLAVATVPYLGTEFMPTLDEGAIAINVVRLPSASLEGAVPLCGFIERALLEIPEVVTVVSKTGRAEISEDPMGPEQSDLFIILEDRSEWRPSVTKADIVDAVRERLEPIPGIKPSYSQPIALRVNELISGIKSDLAVKVFGPDLETLEAAAAKVSAVLSTVTGATDIKVEQVAGFSQVDITFDRETLARYHVNTADVADVIEAALRGKRATTLVEGQARFAVIVRFGEDYRSRVEAIEQLLIRTPDGLSIPLRRFARIEEREAPAQVSRENGMRRVVVEANIRGRDLGGIVTEIQGRLAPVIKELPSGYWIDYGGTFENQLRAQRRLSVIVPISLLLIFVMLLATFGNVRTATLVMANLPFALIGGVATAYFTSTVLSVPAVVGFIALFGVSVQDGVLLVSFVNQLRRQGRPLEAALMEGCSQRLRPVALTSATTIIGLAPFLFAVGAGAEIQRPLATVVLGGMASALVLVLLVLPTMYRLWPPDIGQGEA